MQMVQTRWSVATRQPFQSLAGSSCSGTWSYAVRGLERRSKLSSKKSNKKWQKEWNVLRIPTLSWLESWRCNHNPQLRCRPRSQQQSECYITTCREASGQRKSKIQCRERESLSERSSTFRLQKLPWAERDKGDKRAKEADRACAACCAACSEGWSKGRRWTLWTFTRSAQSQEWKTSRLQNCSTDQTAQTQKDASFF